ncbi:MAG: HAD hydrolase family protein [Bacteroidales bacterium]|nr:HAD hydrolase family protein [Bacteroidales bacterium]
MDFSRIKAICFDVDGVMTDGSLIALDGAEFVRVFNAKDSFAARTAALKGYSLGVFTGGETEGVHTRMLSMGVPEEDIYMRCRGKIKAFNDFCSRHSLRAEDVLYVGDDIPDLPVLKAAGIGAVPADASPELLEAADYVCSVPGGRGCLREIIEKVLRAAGNWTFEPDCYEKIF